MGMLPHADSLLLSLPPSHTLLQPPPRRTLVHRAHVVLFSHPRAATTIAPLCSTIALLCDSHAPIAHAPTLFTYHHIISTILHSSRADQGTVSPIANTRYFAYRNPPDHYSPTQPTRGHNRDRFLCSPIVLLTIILGRCLPPSFDTNAAIVPANKAGPTTLLML
jgi:hypothetical protein